MHFLGVIPARYKSSRFPGKPLVDIGGRSMIYRVYHQALKSKYLNEVVVATDDELIYNHCINAKMQVIMTSELHQSGTDRVAEVAQKTQAEVIINIQGDEPFIPPSYIDSLCNLFSDDKVEIGTLLSPMVDRAPASNPGIVKAVRRLDGRAMYFSRAPIPYQRNHDFEMPVYRHLGIYGFRRVALMQLAGLQRGDLEQYEMLEQLRWMEAGYEIMTSLVGEAPLAVDEPEDVEHILSWMKNEGLG
ncbi:MAG: 3-deoxy-manno-octulosonate cytidylyltransferase [Saprospiraceae bacterium]|nr:3-deoxy-manno-octulosonate cytidylyltransferase [Saprospiraceae bacterium]